MKRFFLTTVLFFLFTGLVLSQTTSIQQLKKHVYTLASDSLEGRGFGTLGGRKAAIYIANQFKDAGILPWKGKYLHQFISEMTFCKVEGANIVGYIEGSDSLLKDEYVVIGAHYDHLAYKIKNDNKVVYNGADDNASGTAVIIEIGRWLSKNRSTLKRSVILIAFDGEEAGLIGSNYLVKNSQIPINKICAMFSLDMVGMLKQYGGINLEGDKTIRNGDDLLIELAKKHQINVKNDGAKVSYRTDTSPFGSIGIPAVHVYTGLISPYHKPEDDANLLDYEGMATITDFMIDAVLALSTREVVEPNALFVAQNSKLGFDIQAGFILGFGSSLNKYEDKFYVAKSLIAAYGGVFAYIGTRHIGIQPEINYLSTGSEHELGKMRVQEINIPVNLRLNLMNKQGTSLFVIGGPYYTYRLTGKLGANDMNFDTDFYREGYGIQYGFGVDLYGVLVVFKGGTHLKSISRTDNIRTDYSTLTLGWRF